ELNLSFPESGKEDLGILVKHTEGETEIESGKLELFQVSELQFYDRINRTLITIVTEEPAVLWTFPVYTITERFGKKVWIYQQTNCLLSWDCVCDVEHNFEAAVTLKIEKR
ncbi:MAG TPA: DUF1926 domain-containing protein, partial [Sediminispirochaeta sp.]|nr:DUF1926 domain-containing protein [Sediminispirochaeta sp.]